jgi:hypothetical protein
LPSLTMAGGVSVPFGKLVADPTETNTMYASLGGRVYQLSLSGSTWEWVDISGAGKDALPGPFVYDLWAGNIAPIGPRTSLLRAAITTRGVWERNITAGWSDPVVSFYLRNNIMDLGWSSYSPTSPPPNPFNPGQAVTHWNSPDIKVDFENPGSITPLVPPFYQTDPENPLPISHVAFDMLPHINKRLPGCLAARVHVQVHNRSNSASGNVWVWVLYADVAQGLPSLNAGSGPISPYWNFWAQFNPDGTITPSLPVGGPWKAVAPPVKVSQVDGANPQIASFLWEINSGQPFPSGQYCLAAFVNSSAAPLNPAHFGPKIVAINLDQVVAKNRQVGEKYVTV